MCCEKKDSCVCGIVHEIVRIQDEVAANNNGCCVTGCDQAIRKLLSPIGTNGNGNGPTTIPFALYCKGDCKPFIGSGVYKSPVGGSGMTALKCVETPIFRAKKFVDKDKDREKDKCCVQLELLLPVPMGGGAPAASVKEKENGKAKTICDFFPGDSIRNLQATGICLTVDLNCFCGIVCLDPITPISVSEFDRV
ncbi:CotY/CotZ family spore coat protein [Jeotgalibacillus haloalkalitolerans]|uniref:CotY/CotZ family spore coat protein n=1 Tax=Jeotgalibacillus haloalkalitolerans TaxID=3104292 RepID=A0ABU5KPJ1_9BACL|nr:CotY/CotZ family spore coat protein [Jeotgalibacillus sp. HH7-29]MDZ5712620.1 CotY/CotZ family spore coat protein [Jeotgalibacillus sp. HH7-29]